MPIIVIDTETGGFRPESNALLSIALVQLAEDLTPTANQLSLFILPEPGMTVEEGAAKINGYTPELWEKRGTIPLKAAMEQVEAWLPAESQALAHNAPFDYGFYIANEDRAGVRTKLARQTTRYAPTWLCSCEKFKRVDYQLKLRSVNHKLATLAAMCGHWGPDYVRGDHQAIDDVLACAAGYRWLVGLEREAAAKKAPAAAPAPIALEKKD